MYDSHLGKNEYLSMVNALVLCSACLLNNQSPLDTVLIDCYIVILGKDVEKLEHDLTSAIREVFLQKEKDFYDEAAAYASKR